MPRPIQDGVGFVVAGLAADLVTNLVYTKMGLGEKLDELFPNLPDAWKSKGATKVAIGAFGVPLMRMLKVPRRMANRLAAAAIVFGIWEMSTEIRTDLAEKIGLADWETVGGLGYYDRGPAHGVLGASDYESRALLGDYVTVDNGEGQGIY